MGLAEVLLANRAAPTADPSVTYAAGMTSANGLGAIDAAQGAAGFADAQRQAQMLSKMSIQDQIKMFSSFDDPTKQRLSSIGYQPQNITTHKSGGFWSDVGGAIAGSVHSAFAGLGHYLGDAAGAVGSALNYPIEQVQHAWRAAEYSGLNDSNTPDLIASLEKQVPAVGAIVGSLNDLSGWADSWHATAHGDQIFTPQATRDVTNTYGQDVFNMAKATIAGNQQKYLDSINDPQTKQKAQEAFTSPQLQEATQKLKDGQLSFGRAVTPQWVWDHAHPLGTAISGVNDAIFDVTLDPTLLAGKANKAYKLAKFSLGSAQDIAKIIDGTKEAKTGIGAVINAQATKQVGAWINDTASYLGKEDYEGLLSRRPNLKDVIPQWQKDGVKTVDDLSTWMKDKANVGAVVDGRLGGAVRDKVTLPSMNPLEQAALNTKGALRKVIDWGADRSKTFDTPDYVASQLGKDATEADAQALNDKIGLVDKGINTIAAPIGYMRKLATMVPAGTTINIAKGDQGLQSIQRLSSTYLSAQATKDVTNAWVGADVAGKRAILESTIRKLGEVTGATDDTVEGMVNHFRNSTNRSYAPEGVDDTINGTSVGIRFSDMDHEWSIPSYKDMAADAKRDALSNAVYKVANWKGFDSFMSYWRPAVVLREAYVPRNAIDEVGSAIVREGSGPLAALGSQAYNKMVADPLRMAYQRLKGETPKDIQQRLDDIAASKPTNPDDWTEAARTLLTNVAAERTDAAMKDTPAYIGRLDYKAAAEKLHDDGLLQSAFADEISAAEGRGTAYGASTASTKDAMENGLVNKPANLKPSGDFVNYRDDHNYYNQMWSYQMRRSSQDLLDREVLANKDMPEEDLVQHVADFIDSPENSLQRDLAHRSKQTSDGRVVGTDATDREASEDWARVAINNVKANFQSPNGQWHDDFVNHALEHYESPGLKAVSDVDPELRPSHVIGPDLVPTTDNAVRQITNKGYGFLNRQLDYVARKPMFIHSYAKADQAVRPIVESILEPGSKGAENMILRAAKDRAIRDVTPFIDSADARSQFATITRNVSPFLSAQQQFLSRWGRTFVHSPEALRKAQIGLSGVEHAGFVQQDDTGQSYLHYPAVGFTQKMLTEGLSLFGMKSVLPITPGMSGAITSMTPGIDNPLNPGVGPLVSIPLTLMQRVFPELEPVNKDVLGSGAGRTIPDQLMPSSFAKIYHALTDDPESSPQLGSAMMQAMQDLDASGHGLKSDAGPMEKEEYMDRVKNWARVLMVTRGIFGFFAPAAPTVNIKDVNMSKELTDLMSAYGPVDGRQRFLDKHPNATAFTVAQSQGPDGLPTATPSTQAAMNALDSNRNFFSKYRNGSSWLLPQDKGKFSYDAYADQLATGLRERKSPDEMLTDILYARASGKYFENEDDYKAKLENAHGQQRTQLQQQWSAYSEDYKARNPVFAAELASANGAAKRGQALDTLRAALNDKAVPKGEQTDLVGQLVNNYDNYLGAVSRYKYNRSSVATRNRDMLKVSFGTWADTFSKENPQVRGLFDRLIRPDIDLG